MVEGAKPGLSDSQIGNASVPAIADDPTAEEERDLQLQWQIARLRDFTDNIKERKKYASRIFKFVVCWVAGVFLILILRGFGIWSFNLPDGVLMTLVGSTTAGVL